MVLFTKGEGFQMETKPGLRKFLSALVIIGSSVVLYIAAFAMAAIVMNITASIVGHGGETAIIGRFIFLGLVLILSWFVFRSTLLSESMKAAYVAMPLIVVLMFIGIYLIQFSKGLVAGAGAVVVGLILLYLYKTKQSWMFYFSTLFTAAVALAVMISGVEI